MGMGAVKPGARVVRGEASSPGDVHAPANSPGDVHTPADSPEGVHAPGGFRADAVAWIRSPARPVAQITGTLGGEHETSRSRAGAAGRADRSEAAARSAALRKEVAESQPEREISRACMLVG
ncbi:hypothetical protein GCM10010517_02750 [Streptosporangium fragile]|uniref:Uncharacterized protein n=1 Tax=Streptosporangium fragile TaxID=46186 RepID=A0ABN3VQP2_9ACTN